MDQNPLYTKQQFEEFEHLLRSQDDTSPILDKLAQRLSDTTDEWSLAYLNYLLAFGYAHQARFFKGTSVLQAAEMHAKQIKDRDLVLKIKALTIVFGFTGKEKRDAKTTALDIIKNTEPGDHLHRVAYRELARHSRAERNFAEAFKYAYEHLQCSITYGDESDQRSAYNEIAQVYEAINELHLAHYYYERSYEMCMPSERRHSVLSTLGSLALITGKLGNLDESARLLRELVKEAKQSVDRNNILSSTYINLSNIYLLKENLERADHYFELAKRHANVDNADNLYQIKVHAAELCIAHSDHRGSIDNLNEALTVGNENGLKHLHIHIHKLLSLNYEQLGEASSALAAYKEYTNLVQNDHTAILAAQKITLNAHTKVKMVEDKVRREHDHITYLQETVSEQELAIAELSHKLTLNEKILHDFWHDLWKESPHLSSHFAGLLKSSKLNEETKRHFSQPAERRRLANKYTQSLASAHPTLTPTELQVLVCARLGLSSIETANIMKTSDRTVEHHRQNARKKMKLPRSTSLVTYLTSIDMD